MYWKRSLTRQRKLLHFLPKKICFCEIRSLREPCDVSYLIVTLQPLNFKQFENYPQFPTRIFGIKVFSYFFRRIPRTANFISSTCCFRYLVEVSPKCQLPMWIVPVKTFSSSIKEPFGVINWNLPSDVFLLFSNLLSDIFCDIFADFFIETILCNIVLLWYFRGFLYWNDPVEYCFFRSMSSIGCRAGSLLPQLYRLGRQGRAVGPLLRR